MTMIIAIDITSKHSTLLQLFTSLNKLCDMDSGVNVLGNMKERRIWFISVKNDKGKAFTQLALSILDATSIIYLLTCNGERKVLIG